MQECQKKAEEVRKNAIYDSAINLMNRHTVEDCKRAIAQFKLILDWRDASQQILLCEEKLNQIEEQLYSKALDAMKRANSEAEYQDAAILFGNIKGYKDSDDFAKICWRKAKAWHTVMQKNLIMTVTTVLLCLAMAVVGLGEGLTRLRKPTLIIPDSTANENELDYTVQMSAIKDAESGEYIVFGKYEQDGDTSNGKEDIEWKVLERQKDRLLLISRYGLDCKKYNEERTDVTWEECTLRQWLNDDFYHSAFTSAEQEQVLLTTVTADENPYYDQEQGNNTEDKVFALSMLEADKYFGNDEKRGCIPTQYAKDQGAFEAKNRNGYWLLRTKGNSSDTTGVVDVAGTIQWTYYMDFQRIVRPVIWLDLSQYNKSDLQLFFSNNDCL